MCNDININKINKQQRKKFSHNLYILYFINKKIKTSSYILRRQNSLKRAKKKSELIHSNLTNEDKIRRIKREYQYVVFMICDKIDILHVFFLKRKFELSRKIREFFTLIKNQNISIERLSSDNKSIYINISVRVQRQYRTGRV